MSKKRQRTAEQQRRDEHDFTIRRCLGLFSLYQEMMRTHLESDEWDGEHVKRMLHTRESLIALLEAAMPIPISTGEVEDVPTVTRAIN
jgi:hypothetical protein